MTAVLIAMAVFLLVNVGVALRRVTSGPDAVDRMMAAQILGAMGIAMALLFGVALDVEGLLDVALVLAVLATLGGIYFARRYHPTDTGGNPEEEDGGHG